MEKEFDFLSNKALCVFNDTEPVVVKYNGETVKNLSAEIEKQDTTENSITYQSEYKSNLMNMSVEGNTEQKKYEGYNLAYCSADNQFADRSTVEILSLNSFEAQKKVDSTGNNSSVRYGVIVKPNTNYKFTCKYTKTGTQGSEPRWMFYKTTSLKASGGTYISGSQAKLSADSGTITRTINTGDAEFLAVHLAVWENDSSNSVPLPSEDFSILIEEFMLVEGTETKPFEQYVGGKPSPNTDYPQEIQNSSNVEVDLRGINLWNSVRRYSQNATYEVIDNNTVKINANGSSLVPIYCFRIDIGGKGGKYRFSLDFKVKNSPNISSANVFNIYYSNSTAVSSGTIVASSKMTFDNDTFTHNRFTVTIPNGYQYLNINFNASHTYATFEDYEAILKNLQCTLTDNYIDFEPYFEPVNVTIPSEVTLADGTVVPLRLAKQNDSADILTIDRVKGKCAYIQKVGLKVFDGTESFVNVGSGYPYRYIHTGVKGYNNVPLLCNYFRNVWNTEIDSTNAEGAFCQYQAMWYFNYDSQRGGIANFKSVLAEWYANGNPMSVQYELATPIEYDLTDTGLGQQLLTLSKSTQNATNTITVNSTLPISKLDVGYAIWGGRDI